MAISAVQRWIPFPTALIPQAICGRGPGWLRAARAQDVRHGEGAKGDLARRGERRLAVSL